MTVITFDRSKKLKNSNVINFTNLLRKRCLTWSFLVVFCFCCCLFSDSDVPVPKH